MILGLVSIQRNRGPWLLEWFAFHYMIGFRKFYFYAHLCDDNTEEIILKLQKRLDITAVAVNDQADRVQLMAFQHTCDNYMNDVDWMAFIDGDEFIFPTQHNTMQEALWPYNYQPMSAVAAYNVNFGSAGHLTEPEGLITENYTRRANIEGFLAHRRVKSIVKGRQKIAVSFCSNVFKTPHGTVDEQMRPINVGYLKDNLPSYEQFRFNHYVCQSREYYEKFKRNSGHADAVSDAAREEDWWTNFNTNEEQDDSMLRFRDQLRATIAELSAAMEA
ncbi:glycosyltransferase family 92 protein [Duganella levis]|uniref:Glycosyltransferase family 92 protein n=1 Tax=Duganella levis TaxID=2692169 RepID=A0ABW9W1J7_9BURK|nr:glycosyltransferase family 92 protein [Duganella levis]MYN27730.1 glycosyltransferase family 92 protein [Duganella levis]